MPIYKWRIYCITESKFKYVYLDEGVSMSVCCPANSTHEVNPDSVANMGVEPSSVTQPVQVIQNDGQVQGKFRSTSHQMIAYGPRGTTTDFIYTYSIPHAIHKGEYVYSGDQEGDVISVLIAAYTTVGVLLAPCTTGSSVVSVSDTAFGPNAFMMGYSLRLFDGTSYSNEVEVIAIHRETTPKTLTVTPVLVVPHTFAANTTIVQMTYQFVKDRQLGPASRLEVGGSILLGSTVPANVPICIRYTNNSDEPYITTLSQVVNIGDTQMTITADWQKWVALMKTNRNYFKIKNLINDEFSPEFKYESMDISGNSVIIFFSPPSTVTLPIGSKVQRTATKPNVFGIEGVV